MFSFLISETTNLCKTHRTNNQFSQREDRGWEPDIYMLWKSKATFISVSAKESLHNRLFFFLTSHHLIYEPVLSPFKKAKSISLGLAKLSWLTFLSWILNIISNSIFALVLVLSVSLSLPPSLSLSLYIYIYVCVFIYTRAVEFFLSLK